MDTDVSDPADSETVIVWELKGNFWSYITEETGDVSHYIESACLEASSTVGGRKGNYGTAGTYFLLGCSSE